MSADLLAEVPLFQLLDEDERVALLSHLEAVTFPKGHIIYNYGEPGDTIYIIRAGDVELSFKNYTGEKIVIEELGCGDFFGEIAFLDAGARTTTALVTSEHVDAILMGRDDLDDFLHKHPAAALDILTALGKRLRKTSEILRRTASRNVNEETEDKRTTVQKVADWIAEFSGSIPFLLIHTVWFAIWIAWNMLLPDSLRFDPYPFGLLTMAVSLEAIFLSVFVLLSQNRQVAKDRVRADIEYEVNLRAEMEVAQLHEKIDFLSTSVLTQLERLHSSTSGHLHGAHHAAPTAHQPRIEDAAAH